MIDTMPIMQLPNLLSAPLIMQKQATTQLSPSLVAKSEPVKAVRPWRLTPPLKKRRVRISLQDDSTPIHITPLHKAAKKTVVTKHTHSKTKKARFSRVIKTRTLKKERVQLTPEARQAMWYQNREYAEIDQESFKNIRALHIVEGDLAKLVSGSNDYCLRGLEMKTSPHIHRLRRLRASITVRAVLDQQDYLRRTGGGNVNAVGESLAWVSRKYTQQAQNRAKELGLIDAIEAQRC